MRLYDREDAESAKAFQAWTIYRDLGPQRSLQKASCLYYGSTANVRQLERWSKRFGWVERARAFDAEREMVRRAAVEDYLKAQAQDHASREAKIVERILEIREQAAEQSLKMLRWPLSEQRTVSEDDSGREVTYVFMPARWAKGTAIQLAQLAAGAVLGLSGDREDEADAQYDLSEVTLEELTAYLALDEKIHSTVKQRPG